VEHPGLASSTASCGGLLVPGSKEPLRTCVGCGAKATQRELTRLRLVEGQVTVDVGRSGGRGAWLHPAQKCLERAMKRRSFGRAFRAPGARTDARVLRDLLTGNTRKD
jgi:predicted RNA-binding protein YlxR (DUF448 family)